MSGLALLSALWMALLGLSLMVAARTAAQTIRRLLMMGALAGVGLTLIPVLLTGMTESTGYVFAGFGLALTLGRTVAERRFLAATLLVLGLSTAAATAAGVSFAASISYGPRLLAASIAVCAGIAVAAQVRLLLGNGSHGARIVVVAGVLIAAIALPVDGAMPWWGVSGELRMGSESIWTYASIDPGSAASRVSIASTEAGLLILGSIAPLLGGLFLVRQHRMLNWSAVGLLIGGAVVLVVLGTLTDPLGGALGPLEVLAAGGRLFPTELGEVRVDLTSLLPVFAACSLAVGLLAVTDRAEPTAGPDGVIAASVSIVLLAGLIALWREVWGAPPGIGAGPLALGAAGLLLAGHFSTVDKQRPALLAGVVLVGLVAFLRWSG